MVGLTLFSAAYLAENVRGGLQSIPHGQEEAAKALGLSGWQVTLFIMLPQALRAVIPALVGQAIALFKDTSLVALVGLVDLLGESQQRGRAAGIHRLAPGGLPVHFGHLFRLQLSDGDGSAAASKPAVLARRAACKFL